MITSNQIKESFLIELKQLLAKHNAELSVEDDGRGHYPKYYIELHIPAVYGGENGYDCVSALVCEDIGTYLHKETK